MTPAETITKPTGTILDRILETKRGEVKALLARESRESLRAQCADLPPTRGFMKALTVRPDTIALIAEIKKASPSKGVIRADFDPVSIARAYLAGGAACLSILTDERYFQGHLSYLQTVRDTVSLPILRKDFVIDTAQIYEARIAGADAILLIVSALPDAGVLRQFRETAESVGLDVLVEVHDEAELELAVQSGATLIGVNNRSLHTFKVRLENSEYLLPRLPLGAVGVAESGFFVASDVARVQKAGARAILVGESLMRADDIESATRKLLAIQ